MLRFFNRTSVTHALFALGIILIGFGAESVGSSFGVRGLGLVSAGLALTVYAYLLGAE